MVCVVIFGGESGGKAGSCQRIVPASDRKRRRGIDIGPQTLAYSAEGGADLVELADQVQCIEQEKSRLQRKMDRSRRASNPDNYAQDGTIKRGVKLTHNKSRRYCKLQKELAYMLYRQAETRKRQHRELINRLLTMGDCFYISEKNVLENPLLTKPLQCWWICSNRNVNRLSWMW